MKDEKLIKDLLSKGESEQLEFKTVFHKESIAKNICGFLNANGGTLLIGVGEDGKIIGVPNASVVKSELETYLVNSIIPEAPITVSNEMIEGKMIVLVKVWNGSKPPYLFNSTIYYRRNDTTVKASPNEISKLIGERQQTELHWERQPALGIELSDLDEFEINKTISDLEKYGRGKYNSTSNVEDFLTYYGLYQNGHLTNAAALLFANEPSRFLPQCRVRLTVFNGTKSSDSYSFDRILEGNLFKNIKEILQFFEVNIATKSNFSDKNWLREDTTYPKLALREGLMNAIIHRDYSNISGTAIVAFYPDHLEISNYGELPKELKPSDLAKNHLSFPRNPDIAHICFLRQFIEKIGRGTIKMIEDCEDKGYGKPIWKSKSGVTTLIFPGVTIISKNDDAFVDAVNAQVTKAIKSVISDIVKERLVAIIYFIHKNQNVKVADLIKTFNVSERTIKDNLKTLIDVGLISYQGNNRSGSYVVDDEVFG